MRVSDGSCQVLQVSIAATIGLTLAAAAWAQSSAGNTRDQEQLRRLRQQVQQLQQAQASAQQEAQKAVADKATMAEQLKGAQAGAIQARSGAASQTRRLAALQADLGKLQSERDGLQAELDKSRAALAQSTARLDSVEQQAAATRTRLSASDGTLDTLRVEHRTALAQLERCSSQNVALLRLGQDLLGRYGNFGVGETLAAREPFLQFKRVELENLAQDYRSRLDEQRFEKQHAPQPTPR